MCGLYGYKTIKPKPSYFKAFEMLAILNEERGIDSTGLCYFTDKAYNIVKDLGGAYDFIEKVKDTIPGNIFTCIGHDRQAVIGKVTKENAQPFEYGDVIGTHNGIINNYATFGTFVVDSEVIFHLLDKGNNNFTDVCSKISGSVAIAWTYKRQLFLSRKDNPLYILKHHDVIFYSSLEYSLKAIAKFLKLKDFKIEEVRANSVYEIADDLAISEYKVIYKENPTYNYGWRYGDEDRSYDDWTRSHAKEYKDIELETDENLLDLDNPKNDQEEEDFQCEYTTTEADYLKEKQPCKLCNRNIKQDQYYYNETKQEIYHEKCLKVASENDLIWVVDSTNPERTSLIELEGGEPTE